ncbi:hypothetical protein ANCDUO_16434 [Ancylostoma duodenale]|uniref:Uncharacterized protein n=1 Tax=Ancylostoma duodenale TaxID=51022 RepID=A0A0C2G8X4_9BILA|nr:hypothetical protein ANCDUO_16434 [Ancylostoma duodenale]
MSECPKYSFDKKSEPPQWLHLECGQPPSAFAVVSLRCLRKTPMNEKNAGLDTVEGWEDSPDSGLGCSGPVHIEDWASLSILLPK